MKVLAPGTASLVLAIVSFPWFVAAFAGVSIGALAFYSYYATVALKRKDAALRWAWVANKRLNQRWLRVEDASDKAVLAIMGDPRDRGISFRTAPSELRAAIRHRQAKNAQVLAAQRPQPKRVAARGGGVPEGPRLDPIRNRIAVREAQIKELEAEIQALAVPEDVEAQMAAAAATLSRKQVEHNAREADKLARENRRRGRPATTDATPISLSLGIKPNGDSAVKQLPAEVQPEQIAREGEG